MSGATEVAYAYDLQVQCGAAAKGTYDPPRNQHHTCLIELELEEGEFQQQRSEGALGDGDTKWPRMTAVYEADQPLDFDLVCRVGSVVRIVEQENEGQRSSSARFNLNELQPQIAQYLPGAAPDQSLYLLLSFDRARPSRACCCVYAPILGEAWMCFSGFDASEGATLRPAIEQLM